MTNMNQPADDRQASDSINHGAQHENYLALAIGLNILSILGSTFIVSMAVSSTQSPPSENFAALSLCVLGIPTFIAQIIVFLPLIFFCIKKLTIHSPKIRTNWLRNLAVLLPAVTLTAIVTGLAVSGVLVSLAGSRPSRQTRVLARGRTPAVVWCWVWTQPTKLDISCAESAGAISRA
jgi:multisubunit Na+/H+ antiporter MnhC subunit